MSRKLFWLLFCGILFGGYLLRVIPTQNNNFFFTIDQGYDAVHAREFFEQGRILLAGPETGIKGIHAGPGWFYFISVGYKLFSGHPFGALFMVIVLSLVTTGLLMWQIGRHVSPWVGLLVGAALQLNWFFYDTSRWAFNPFVLPFSAFILILLLVRFLSGDQKSYLWAVLPTIVGFNAEVAGAAAMFVFYLLVGMWGLAKGRLGWGQFLVSTGLLPVLGLVGILKQVVDVARFSQGSALGTFSGTNFVRVGQAFGEIVGNATVPQTMVVGILGFLGVLGLFFRQRTQPFVRSFVLLSLGLFVVSYFFFASNRGWQDWHDLYLPPLLFVSLLLMLFSLWRELKVRYYKAVWCVLFGLVVGSQLWVFGQRYRQYLEPSDNPSILANQLNVLDWIYTHNENDGFNLYTASENSFYDWHYQYLVWWYGGAKYGFVPCEYANFPKSIKYLYVPGSKEHYSEPKLGCDRLRFLIIEPASSNEWIRKHWGGILRDTRLVEEATIGSVRVEKRE